MQGKFKTAKIQTELDSKLVSKIRLKRRMCLF